MQKAVLTIHEASKEYGIPEAAVRTLVKRGEFPVIRVGNRNYISKKVFEDYLERGGKPYEG